MLDLLDRSNMFLVPLDGNRHWYRYHHLFADVLHAHLDVELAADVSGLHQRAGRWYDAAGEPVAAVRHLLAAGDVSTAADLVERSILQLLRDRREVTARGWLDDIPEEEVAVRPVLAVGFIGALMSSGDFADVERRLDDVERLLERARTDESVKMVVVDPAELARLPGAIEMYRAGVALVGGDPSATVAHADRAIARAPEGDDVIVSAAAALSGLASWGLGDLESAHRGYSTAVVGLRRAGHYSDVLGCSITLADIRITQGRLTDAVRTYADALQLAATHEEHGVAMRGTPDMLVGLGQVALERNDLEGAAEYLSRAEQLGEHLGLPQHPYRLRVARSRMCEVRGDVAGAIELLEDADRVYVGDFSPDVRPISALRARLLLRHDRLAEALAWAGEQQLSAEDDLSYVRELEHLTLARILLRQYSVDGSTSILRNAHDLLERLQEAAEAGGRAGTLIEILTVQALARHAGGADASGTLEPLERALRLAEPEGPVRVFVDEGVPLRGLLATLAHQHRAWEYPRRLLAAYGAPGPTPTHAAPDVGLVDPLSARELDVLRLLATDLAGPAIARQLVVSLNTVRTHTKNIYAKLGVNNRREAVTRAGLLDLLSPSGSR
jgi:LuxR family maltose regulon positive regulatory protein